MTERKQPESWRWAVVGEKGSLLEEGFEPDQPGARRAAEEALQQITAAKSAP